MALLQFADFLLQENRLFLLPSQISLNKFQCLLLLLHTVLAFSDLIHFVLEIMKKAFVLRQLSFKYSNLPLCELQLISLLSQLLLLPADVPFPKSHNCLSILKSGF
ncbi:hypothetical protein Mapa_011821 [Marchantia paleacea]|nr:hypothetical protein Mapa_011821 [Marchantia paleacea]